MLQGIESALPGLARFVVVGAAGFAVDGGLLILLMERGHDVVPSRLLSFLVAVTITWSLNRVWTFSATKRRDKRREYAGYLIVQVFGAAINLAFFFLFLMIFPAQRAHPLIALLVGAVPALLFNYTASKYFVFRDA